MNGSHEDLVTPGNVSLEVLKGIFRRAYYTVGDGDETQFVVSDIGNGYLVGLPSQQVVHYTYRGRLPKTASLAVSLAFANTLNLETLFGRAAIHLDGERLAFVIFHSIWLGAGVPAATLVSAFRWWAHGIGVFLAEQRTNHPAVYRQDSEADEAT